MAGVQGVSVGSLGAEGYSGMKASGREDWNLAFTLFG